MTLMSLFSETHRNFEQSYEGLSLTGYHFVRKDCQILGWIGFFPQGSKEHIQFNILDSPSLHNETDVKFLSLER